MKRFLLFITVFLFLVLGTIAWVPTVKYCLASPVASIAGESTEPVDGVAVDVSDASKFGITIIFSRATGSSAKVFFDFHVSYDGVNYTTDATITCGIASDTSAGIGNQVRSMFMFQAGPYKHVKLYQIRNEDSSAITNCTAAISK